MKESFLSTREVAELLNVTETTVKRWTDSGRLKCIKTLGGHRKYSPDVIESFAKQNNIPVTGVTSSLNEAQLEKLGFAVYSGKLSNAVDVIIEEALQGDREGMFDLLLFLTKNRIKYAVIIDQIIQPALEKIGELWEKNKLDVNQEHLASDTIKTALARLVVYLPKQTQKKLKVLCACTEGEHHDIGLQAIGFQLELNGYTLHYLGADTPFTSLVKVIKKERPAFIFLSATAPVLTEKDFNKGVLKISKTVKEVKAKLICGGRYFNNFKKETLGCDAIVSSIKETISFIHKQK